MRTNATKCIWMRRFEKILILILVATSAFGQDLKRPTTDVAGSPIVLGCGFGGSRTSTAMPDAYDNAGLLTSSINSSASLYKSSKSSSRVFKTWQGASGSYSALGLYINTQSPGWNSVIAGTGTGEGCIAYSLDSGLTWTSVVCDSGTGWPQQTFTIGLLPTQDLSTIQVGVCTYADALSAPGDVGGDGIYIYDIWTLGTAAAVPTGNGSSAGQAHRTTVVVN